MVSHFARSPVVSRMEELEAEVAALKKQVAELQEQSGFNVASAGMAAERIADWSSWSEMCTDALDAHDERNRVEVIEPERG